MTLTFLKSILYSIVLVECPSVGVCRMFSCEWRELCIWGGKMSQKCYTLFTESCQRVYDINMIYHLDALLLEFIVLLVYGGVARFSHCEVVLFQFS